MRTKVIMCISLMFVCFGFPVAQAVQETGALSIAQTALELANQNCNAMSRNQACYGHDLLTANPRPGANPFTFVAEGDIEDLSKIQSLRLSGLDQNAGTWGVALMQLRANLPANRPENVTLVAFGDVQLENAVLPATQAEIQIKTRSNLNVRQLPSTNAGVIGVLSPGQNVTAVERLADSAWLRVLLPESEQSGWVLAELVSSSADLTSLNTAAADAPYIQEPMQAFYFSSAAADSSTFSSIPENGLVIQTPEGVGEVQLLINEINVQLGSTVFFQAQPGSQMTISTLEGHADIRAFGIEQTAYAGTQVTIPLTEDLKPGGPPSLPQPYDKARMETLPTDTLPRPVTVAEPMTFAEIQEQQAAQFPPIPGTEDSNNPGGSNAANGVGEAACCPVGPDNGQDDCPGQSCNAPGRGGSCPGNSCNAPGKNKGN